MRKRTGYNHWGGSGMRRSTAIIPTKARNGAMYPMVARRRESMDRSMCDKQYGVLRLSDMLTHCSFPRDRIAPTWDRRFRLSSAEISAVLPLHYARLTT